MSYSDLFKEVLKVKYNNDSTTNEIWPSVNDDQLNQMVIESGMTSVENANRLRKISAMLEYLGDNTKGIARKVYDPNTQSVKIRVDLKIIIERLKNMKIEQMEQEDTELFSIISKKKSDERREELSKFGNLVSDMKRQIENEREQFFREHELKNWKRAEKEKGIRELRERNKKEREIDLEKRRSSVNVKEIIKLLNRDHNYYIQQKVDMLPDKDFTKNPVGGFPGSWDGSEMDFWMFEDLNDYPTFREKGNLVTSHLKNIEKPEYSVHPGPEAPQWERNFRVREYSSMIEAVDRFFQDEVNSAGQDTFKFTFSFGSIH